MNQRSEPLTVELSMEASMNDMIPVRVTVNPVTIHGGRQSHGGPRGRHGTLTIGEFVDHYATTRAVRDGSIRQYRIAAAAFERWSGRSVPLDELDEWTVSAWLRDYATSVSPATVRSKRNQLLALWRAAADELLCEPPRRRVRTAAIPWVPRDCWTAEEVRTLVAAAARLKRRHRCGMPRSQWFGLAIRLAWDTGLRWGDLVSMRTADINGDRFVVCQSKTGRHKSGRLNESTVEALDASLRAWPRDVVVPWPATHQSFAAQVRRLVSIAGVRPGTWKWLRRGSGTNVEMRRPGCGAAARQLGHAPGSRIAEIHYVNPAIVEAGIEVVRPDDLG